ncbi:hypothetical protein ACF1AY_38695 [Streptomyces sp. NPDC014776]|uniref:hypothetical protein n=1 Tax=unclassified Streptomyces TaxID=2593676 RepID=UPI0036F65631
MVKIFLAVGLVAAILLITLGISALAQGSIAAGSIPAILGLALVAADLWVWRSSRNNAGSR